MLVMTTSKNLIKVLTMKLGRNGMFMKKINKMILVDKVEELAYKFFYDNNYGTVYNLHCYWRFFDDLYKRTSHLCDASARELLLAYNLLSYKLGKTDRVW